MSPDDARTAILARVRQALGAGMSPGEVPRGYRTEMPPETDRVERFAERVADYRATVRRVTEDELPGAIAEVLAGRNAKRVVSPPGLPDPWRAVASVDWLSDEPALSHAELNEVDSVVTACAVAIAETGTIVLDAGDGQGRRALSLLPDHHVCVVRVEQIVGDVPEALPHLDPRRPLTWISGPSATSDIELQRIEGVHGPRNLEVLIVGDNRRG